MSPYNYEAETCAQSVTGHGMINKQKGIVFEMMRKRSEKSFSYGGDGLLKVVGRGVGREHKYRTTKIFNQLIH
nr:hypothetical protein [Escherichia coli]